MMNVTKEELFGPWKIKRLLLMRIFFSFFLLQVSAIAFSQSSQQITKVSQSVIVKGTVKDNTTGESIPGVHIILEGSKLGTTTDLDGNFNLSVPGVKSVLDISFMGYISQSIVVGSKTVLNIKLVTDLKKLDEVLVVGYGTQTKLSITGAVGNIKGQDLMRSPVSNIGNAIAGRATGVATVQRSGEPGRDNADIYIRGIATFVGDNAKPLFLVDGIERSISTLDPNEIESINILKDASATAVYGIRGANGVVVITTKQGTAGGKPEINFSSNFAWQNPTRLPKLLDAYDWTTLRNEAAVNDGLPKPFSSWDLERYKKGDDPMFHPNIDWMKYVMKDYAPQQQYNLNIRGGSTAVRYFVSLGFFDQAGAYKMGNFFREFSSNPEYKRYNIRANLDIDWTKRFSTSIKAGTQIVNSNYAASNTSDILGTVYAANPIMSPVVADGKLIRSVEGLTAWNISNTPLYQLLTYGYDDNFSSNLNLDVSAKYDLTDLVKGLSARIKVAYDGYYNQDGKRSKQIPMWDLKRNPNAKTFADSIVPLYIVNQYEGPISYNSETFTRSRKLYAEAALDYNRNFGKHDVTALLLATKERTFNAQAAYSPNLPFNYMGIVSRLTYKYKSIYFGEVNMGYNGSENFAKGKTQFGFFPSISLAYTVSEEPFFPKNPYLKYVKVRGSYGKVGNDKAGSQRFLFLSSSWKSSGNYYFGQTPTAASGYAEGSIGNPDVTWETALKSNIGLDLKFLEYKLSLSVDVFNEKRSNILSGLNIPVTFGPSGLISSYNIGVAENKGIEMEFGYKNEIKKYGINYWANANYSFSKNKIIYSDETPQPFPGMVYTGGAIGQTKGLIAEGLYNTMDEINDPKRPISAWEGAGLKPGDIRYKDVNGDGVINDFDVVDIGYPSIPQIIYGISGGIERNGLDLSLLFQGAGNVSTYLGGYGVIPFSAGTGSAAESAKESWSQERYDQGLPISLPRITTKPEGSYHNYRRSSFWQSDASYVRLKNLEIGYRFNAKRLKNIGLKGLRVFANGQNLYTWSKMKYYDPEVTSGNAYPLMRVFNMGFSVQF